MLLFGIVLTVLTSRQTFFYKIFFYQNNQFNLTHVGKEEEEEKKGTLGKEVDELTLDPPPLVS